MQPNTLLAQSLTMLEGATPSQSPVGASPSEFPVGATPSRSPVGCAFDDVSANVGNTHHKVPISNNHLH